MSTVAYLDDGNLVVLQERVQDTYDAEDVVAIRAALGIPALTPDELRVARAVKALDAAEEEETDTRG